MKNSAFALADARSRKMVTRLYAAYTINLSVVLNRQAVRKFVGLLALYRTVKVSPVDSSKKDMVGMKKKEAGIIRTRTRPRQMRRYSIPREKVLKRISALLFAIKRLVYFVETAPESSQAEDNHKNRIAQV